MFKSSRYVTLGTMIRLCVPDDLDDIRAVINDGAQGYLSIIPADRWHSPYMSHEALVGEIAAGVVFWGFEREGSLVGVMGLQHVGDVTLIRHAYLRSAHQRHGIGARLLVHLRESVSTPILVGTWADASWAIRFYERHGFGTVSPDEKDRLLRTYWSVPERQIETSVVLADDRWRALAATRSSTV